jgi:hypothetical protein
VAVKDYKDNDRARERLLSGTFADLPAPELEWEQMPSAPVPRLDGAAIQIKNLFYVFSGYGTIDYVSILFPTLIVMLEDSLTLVLYLT